MDLIDETKETAALEGCQIITLPIANAFMHLFKYIGKVSRYLELRLLSENMFKF